MPNLKELSVQEREEHLALVRQECIEFREPKKDFWMDSWRIFRGLADSRTPTRAKVISSYAWSAVQSQMAMLEPLLFSATPTFDLWTPRDEDSDRNALLEDLLTQQVQFQSNLRETWTQILLEALVFGASYPWTYFKSIEKPIGPTFSPILDQFGNPVRDPMTQEPVIRKGSSVVRTVHAPWVEHISLWDSFIHPDSRRGFSRRLVTGYDLRRASLGPSPMYDTSRVNRMLRIAEMLEGNDPSKKTSGGENYFFGDDTQVIDDELAQEAGTQVGHRLDDWRAGYRKDVLAMKFPILHYDDGDCSGSYALNVDGRLYELRYNPYSGPDGGSYRMAVTPNSSPQEVFGVSFIEANYDLLQVYHRFLQLAIDGASLSVSPVWAVSKRYDQEVGEIFTHPGAINVVPTMSGEPMERHITRMDMPQTWQAALGFRDVIRDELDQAFAANETTFGRFAGGRKTAQEVSQVLHFSASRAQLLGERIGDHFGRPLGRKWLALDTAYMDNADLEKVLGVRWSGFEMPDPEEIIATMQVVFKGSVLASNNAAKLGQIQAVAQGFLNSLQFLELPHVQEFMKEWFRLAGLEAVSKKLPAPIPGLTAFDIIKAQGGNKDAGASPTGGGLPRTPTDMSGMMAAQGGATAPPGPAGGY